MKFNWLLILCNKRYKLNLLLKMKKALFLNFKQEIVVSSTIDKEDKLFNKNYFYLEIKEEILKTAFNSIFNILDTIRGIRVFKAKNHPIFYSYKKIQLIIKNTILKREIEKKKLLNRIITSKKKVVSTVINNKINNLQEEILEKYNLVKSSQKFLDMNLFINKKKTKYQKEVYIFCFNRLVLLKSNFFNKNFFIIRKENER